MKNFGYNTSVVFNDNTSCDVAITKNLTQIDRQKAIQLDEMTANEETDACFEFYFSENIEDAIREAHYFPIRIEYCDLTEEDKLEVIRIVEKMIADGTMAKNFPRLPEREYDEHAVDMWKKVLLNKAVYTCDFDKLNKDLENRLDDIKSRFGVDKPDDGKTIVRAVRDNIKDCCQLDDYEDIDAAKDIMKELSMCHADYLMIADRD
jgi:hypothetical protein